MLDPEIVPLCRPRRARGSSGSTRAPGDLAPSVVEVLEDMAAMGEPLRGLERDVVEVIGAACLTVAGWCVESGGDDLVTGLRAVRDGLECLRAAARHVSGG